MDVKKHDYLVLFAVVILFVAVFAGVFLNKLPVAGSQLSGISGSFALSNCDELNNLFLQNNCYGPGDYDGYTCMKISEAKYQLSC